MKINASSEVATLYVTLREEICQFLRSRFGDGPPEPEDMVQAAFTRYASMGDKSHIVNPRAFLYAAARNLTIDELRRNVRSRNYSVDAAHHADQENLDQRTPEHVLAARESCAAVRAAVEAMSDEQREALMLHRLHGLSLAEVSLRMGTSKTSVHRLIADAMLLLHSAVTADESPAEQRPTIGNHGTQNR